MINGSSVVPKTRCTGFTLVEAIVVIVITGILAGMVAVFIKAPVEGYVDSVRRAELTDAADTAVRRIARDIRTALPNSFRFPTTPAAGTACIEFLPTVGGGRYRTAPTVAGVSTGILDFSQAINAFDVLANSNLPASLAVAGTQHVVIYNLGFGYSGADAYAGDNRAQIRNNTATNTNITLTADKKFPHESPGKRFHVIPDNSVIYSCVGGANGTIFRSTPIISPGALVSCPAAGSVLVSNVDCTNTSFQYSPISASSSLLAMTMTLTRSGESVRIYHEVQVSNVP